MAFRTKRKPDQSDHAFVQSIVDASMHLFRFHSAGTQRELAYSHSLLRLKIMEGWDETVAKVMIAEHLVKRSWIDWTVSI